MYTRAEHCTVFLDKAALTSYKLVWCCRTKCKMTDEAL